MDSETDSWSWILNQSRMVMGPAAESWSWRLDHSSGSGAPTMVTDSVLLVIGAFLPTELVDLLRIAGNFSNPMPSR
jgi:hypothetical protein